MFQSVEVPAHLQHHLERFRRQWFSVASESCQQALSELLEKRPALRQELAKAIIGSDFIASCCLGQPDAFVALLTSSLLHTTLSDEAIRQQLDEKTATDDEASFDSRLRLWRRDFMVRIIWRDLNRLSPLEDTTRELSTSASACIQAALDFHYPVLARQRGIPVGADTGSPQPMLVLGMGKLGAEELNVSSDIDLIFAYPEAGETEGAKGSLSNQEFFVRLGQRVIKSLDTITPDGFVFRVDMRLRPYGGSGPLVMSFNALENYYQTQGREWERFAMIKARVVATSADAMMAATQAQLGLADSGPCRGSQYAGELMELLQPFTFRRYLDFSAIEAMRAMKQLITREVSRKGLHNDVKLGAGGIRELEFIVQVFQLIRGGREPQLQERQLLKVLPLLVRARCLPAEVVEDLERAYRFLRDVEHALQGFADRQTQQLPVEADNQIRLAWIMGFDSWDDFMAELYHQRKTVSAQFHEVIAEPEERQQDGTRVDAAWYLLWEGSLGTKASQEFLREQGIDESGFASHLEQLRESRAVTRMLATSRERLDQLMPLVLSDLTAVPNPEQTLERVCGVLEAVARRSAYIVLLVENPNARQQLIKLCSASIWIARELSDQPVLLDELLDARTLYSPPDMDRLRSDLQRHTLRLDPQDLEEQMEALRYFRRSHALRVAACEVTDLLPLMKVSDYLTFLAEVILQHVLELAWQQMIASYGYPRRADGSVCSVDPENGDFIIVGYGKLGGIELGHGSDLDLVFVHRADPNLSTDGERALDNATFFMRLGQKILHILSTQTVLGKLYDIDMRLRPSGNSGLLVSTLAAFAKYQENDAWTWEHQALVRARVVAGSRDLATEFEAVRRQVLSRERNTAELKQSVVEMREKMRKHRSSAAAGGSSSSRFHLKHDPGGIVDIEFMVQYAVLAWARSNPTLTRYTDNIRILGCLAEAGLMTSEDAEQLVEAYKTYRSTVHRLALQGLPSTVEAHEFLVERSLVIKLWQQLLIIR